MWLGLQTISDYKVKPSREQPDTSQTSENIFMHASRQATLKHA
jgi:hypothetical protein